MCVHMYVHSDVYMSDLCAHAYVSPQLHKGYAYDMGRRGGVSQEGR